MQRDQAMRRVAGLSTGLTAVSLAGSLVLAAVAYTETPPKTPPAAPAGPAVVDPSAVDPSAGGGPPHMTSGGS